MEDSQLEARDAQQKDGPSVDESLWFSSDMVILRVQSATFKVFAAVLKAQSSVFADMFAIPQPPSADVERIEGVPVVDLHDDPQELGAFLRAIFYSNFFMPPPALSQFSHTIGILRLSHKYDVPYLRRRALQHLDIRGRGRNPNDLFHCIATIQTVTEAGALWLLPYTYYDMCKHPVAALLSSPHWDLLDEKQRHTALVGHPAQARAFPEIVKFLITWTTPDECEDPDGCRNLRADFANKIPWQQMSWPLEVYSAMDAWAQWEVAGVCTHCITHARRELADAQQAFWARLPGIFGLPCWNSLMQIQREQMAPG